MLSGPRAHPPKGALREKDLVQAVLQEEKAECWTWKELKVLSDQYIDSMDEEGDVIVHFTDNQAVESIMEKGSSKPHLQETALRIYRKF